MIRNLFYGGRRRARDAEPDVRALRGAGRFTVVNDPNTTEAVARMIEWRPTLRARRLKMPAMGGLRRLRAIRAARPQCQVIL